jgi:bifunctional NMN adenylyltransferase/nudix hydrolase
MKISLGVIVARFQVPELTVGHIALLNTVRTQCERVIVFLGYNETLAPTKRDPLSLSMRIQMLRDFFKANDITNVEVHSIMDMPGQDERWSKHLDTLIEQAWHLHGGTVRLYGGRDSFIPHYKGRYSVSLIEDMMGTSGTSIRRTVREQTDLDFRRGVIWAAQHQFDRVFPTVDIAILDHGRVLLGKKPGETLWRFPGGFVDPSDYTLEAAAIRELQEETGLVANHLDTLFRGYLADMVNDTPKAGDDLASLDWVLLSGWALPQIDPAHRELFSFLLGHLRRP